VGGRGDPLERPMAPARGAAAVRLGSADAARAGGDAGHRGAPGVAGGSTDRPGAGVTGRAVSDPGSEPGVDRRAVRRTRAARTDAAANPRAHRAAALLLQRALA